MPQGICWVIGLCIKNPISAVWPRASHCPSQGLCSQWRRYPFPKVTFMLIVSDLEQVGSTPRSEWSHIHSSPQWHVSIPFQFVWWFQISVTELKGCGVDVETPGCNDVHTVSLYCSQLTKLSAMQRLVGKTPILLGIPVCTAQFPVKPPGLLWGTLRKAIQELGLPWHDQHLLISCQEPILEAGPSLHAHTNLLGYLPPQPHFSSFLISIWKVREAVPPGA